ncbi:hypothetical protein G4B88_017856 [Cannabis sativa]|uniref:Retrotransposon gag domain-containing protein n=1 Tax=Cannabis sativa TaxID=3483 RepID=A0A7J6GQ54_CANSA|nr:hypothetical protein G4B88_017856 [Cannabis sativa]
MNKKISPLKTTQITFSEHQQTRATPAKILTKEAALSHTLASMKKKMMGRISTRTAMAIKPRLDLSFFSLICSASVPIYVKVLGFKGMRLGGVITVKYQPSDRRREEKFTGKRVDLGIIKEVIDMCDFAVGLSRQLNGSIIPSERLNHMMLEVWNPLGNNQEYNGTGDPSEYVRQIEQKMLTVSVPLEDLEAIKCKTFTQGLRGPTLRWFHNLPSATVNSYQDLILRFQTNFAISVWTAKVDTDLMLIRQRFDEPLEKFINRFSEEYVSIPKCTNLVAMKALMQGLLHGSELKKAIIVEPGLSLTRALTMARGYVALEVEEKQHSEEVSRETSTLGDTFLFESKNRTPAARPHNRTDNRSVNERNT